LDRFRKKLPLVEYPIASVNGTLCLVCTTAYARAHGPLFMAQTWLACILLVWHKSISMSMYMHRYKHSNQARVTNQTLQKEQQTSRPRKGVLRLGRCHILGRSYFGERSLVSLGWILAVPPPRSAACRTRTHAQGQPSSPLSPISDWKSASWMSLA